MKKLLLLVSPLFLACSHMTWNTPAFSHGPSLAVTEIPIGSVATPVRVAEGAGYMVSLGLGQFILAGKSWDALDISASVIGSPGPGANAEGAIQLVPMLGTFNNLVGLGPVFTPWAVNGDGFIQGGRPGTSLAILFNFPIAFGPYSPPVGIPSEGAAAYPRGATWYIGAP